MKLLNWAVPAAALLALAACSSPTGNSKNTGGTGTAFPLTFEGTSLPSGASIAAGYQNSATIAALSLDTSNNGSISSGGRNFAYSGSGTKTWPDSVSLGTQTLKMVLRTDDATSNGGSHVVLTFTGLDLSDMSTKTGLEFYMYVPQASSNALADIGVSPILRYNDGLGTSNSENHVVFTAPLNDPTAENFSPGNSASVYDWVYFGDGVFLHFKIPFTCFSVPGWAPSGTNVYSTVAAALAAGVKFNEFNIDFRMDTTATGGGAADTDYPAYLDNVGFY
jgi:hypothetical protein